MRHQEPAGWSRNPANGQHAAYPPSRGDVTAVSPRLPSGALLALTAAMTAATAVVAAVPASASAAAPGGPAAIRAGTAPAVRSDRVRAQEWWLGNLHVPQAWQVSRGAGITVAVLSSGVEATHPDLTGSVVTGPDFTGSGGVPGAASWAIEGTSAASIIAGHGDNVGQASGIIGVAPAARILSIRVVLDATDPLNANPADVGRLPAAIAAGIRYAAGHGAQVIDLPLDPASLASDGAATGGLSAAAGGSPAERAAVNYALGKGSVLVAPAGDNGEDGNEPTFPASYPGVIALGAVDRHFVRAPFSIRQSYVALTAPGVNLTTASPPSGYRNMSTTDAASAIVAGVAALIRSRYPGLTGSQVRQALLAGGAARPRSATTPGDGAGTVDALKAVEAAALIAAPRASASAPSTSPAKAQAPPGKIRPAESHPATGILSRAWAVPRDAAMAAGTLIVLLLASLIGIRVRRRRAERATLPAPEPRTLLGAPSGPLAAGARHTRAAAEERAAAAHAAAPGAARWTTGPPPPPPGGQDRQTHGLPVRVTPAPRTVTRAEISAPGGPPWDPAPMPEGEVPHEPVQRAPDPFALFAPSAPATSAPWDADQPGPVAGAGPIAPPGHPASPPGPRRPGEEMEGREPGALAARGEFLFARRGVHRDVLLTGQFLNRPDHLVGDGPARLAGCLASGASEITEGHRLPDPYLDAAQTGDDTPRGQHAVRADHGDGDHGKARVHRQPAHPGPGAVQPPIGGAGAFGIDAEELPVAQQGEGSLEHFLGRARTGPVHRQLARSPYVKTHEPQTRSLAGEVLRLGRERHRAVEHQRQENRVHHGQVVGRQDGPACVRNVLSADDPRPPQPAQERPGDEPR